MCRDGFCERERAIDLYLQLAACYPLKHFADHGMDANVLCQDRAAEKDTVQRVVTRLQRPRLDLRTRTSGHTDTHERSPICEHTNTVDEVLATDRVENDLHPARVGQPIGALDETLGRKLIG